MSAPPLADVPSLSQAHPLRAGIPVQSVARRLREGEPCDDVLFDRFLPEPLMAASCYHWTPLEVAARVAQWLTAVEVDTLVDVGSGAGKLCVAVALACGVRTIGYEQRLHLVKASEALARTFAVNDRVSFVHGVTGQTPLPEGDAYYLFNPFGENLFTEPLHVDTDVELSSERFDRDVAFTEAFFARARLGTFVIEYNGFGGVMPSCYELIFADARLPNPLRMWRKIRRAR